METSRCVPIHRSTVTELVLHNGFIQDQNNYGDDFRTFLNVDYKKIVP